MLTSSDFPGCCIGDNRWQKPPDDHCFLMCITKLKSNPKVIVMATVYQDLDYILKIVKLAHTLLRKPFSS